VHLKQFMFVKFIVRSLYSWRQTVAVAWGSDLSLWQWHDASVCLGNHIKWDWWWGWLDRITLYWFKSTKPDLDRVGDLHIRDRTLQSCDDMLLGCNWPIYQWPSQEHLLLKASGFCSFMFAVFLHFKAVLSLSSACKAESTSYLTDGMWQFADISGLVNDCVQL